MNTHRSRTAAIILALGLLPAGAAWGGDPHDFAEQRCGDCHRVSGDVGSPGEDDLKAGIDAQCVKCHSACSHGRKHGGSQGNPSVMSVSLPLDSSGRMACHTCHDPHMNEVEPGTRQKTRYLRIANLKRELCLNCHRTGSKTTGSIKVLFPPPAAVVPAGYVPLLGRAESVSDERLTLFIDGVSFSVPIQDRAFYTRVKLEEGHHRLALGDGTDVLWSTELWAFSGEGAGLDEGLVARGHQVGSRKECLGCHDQVGWSSTEAGPPADLCARCHPGRDGKRYLHGPVAVGDCLICHAPHGGTGKDFLRAGADRLCRECHSPTETDDPRHRAASAVGTGCLACHDPHQSDTWYLGRTDKLSRR